MKKHLFFLTALLLGTLATNAQITTFPYTQGFESGLGGWTVIDADGDGHNWEASTTSDYIHSGSGVACSWSYDDYTYDSYTPDNYLISPAITVSGDLTLKYWIMNYSS